MTTPPSLNIMLTAVEDCGEEPYTQIWNVAERLTDLILGFGNGVWCEMRVVAETVEALEAFRLLMSKGGYSIAEQPAPEFTLYQRGDESWAGFVFLDPAPKPLPKTST